MTKRTFKQRWIKKAGLWFVISMVIEILICNFRTWQTMGYQEIDLIREGYIACSNGQYEENGYLIAPFRDDGWCDIDTIQMDLPARNIYLNLQYLDDDFQPMETECVTDCTVKASDEGHKLLYGLGSRKFSDAFERGNYYRIHLYGNAKAFELTFQKPDDQTVTYVWLTELVINKKVPFYFSWVRFCGMLLCCGMISLCRAFRNEPFYSETGMQRRKAAAAGFAAVLIVYSLAFTNVNTGRANVQSYRKMYHDLTESLLQGKLYLEEEPAPALLTMDNPYDNRYRDQLLEECGQSFQLDAAYYNGKYYVYFGVVPVLLLFLPFYVVTGQHLPMTSAISVLGIAYIAGCFCLLWKIYKKYFSRASFLSYLLWSAMMVVGCGMFYAFRTASFYACPILTAAALTVWAFVFWMEEAGKNEHQYFKIAAGALLLSLTAGSRPQFLVAAFSIFVLFQKEIFRKPDREWGAFAVSVLTPVLLVAAALMYYNYARFSNPFDFGANYNLTSNDMTHRGWQLDRIPSGLFYYLFEPSKITLAFPYVQDSGQIKSALNSYMGRTIFEAPYGGLFFNSPVLLLSLAVLKVKKYASDHKRMFQLAVFFSASAWVIMLTDVQMAGIINRYHMDFGIFFCLSAMIVMALLQERTNEDLLIRLLHLGLAFSLLWRFVYEICLWFHESSLAAQRPFFMFYIRSLIEFWR